MSSENVALELASFTWTNICLTVSLTVFLELVLRLLASDKKASFPHLIVWVAIFAIFWVFFFYLSYGTLLIIQDLTHTVKSSNFVTVS